MSICQARQFIASHAAQVLVNHLVACVWYAIGNMAPVLQVPGLPPKIQEITHAAFDGHSPASEESSRT